MQPNLDSSPTCEVPGWHTSLAQRSLKYLDAPLSSAYEEPPLTFVSANGRGLWGQSGDWDLRTGSGQPVKVCRLGSLDCAVLYSSVHVAFVVLVVIGRARTKLTNLA